MDDRWVDKFGERASGGVDALARALTGEVAAGSGSIAGVTDATFASSLIARDRAAVWHPYTSLADPIDPLPVVSAEREFLRLADGRTLIDAVSSWWTILHGHHHPALMESLRDAAGTLDHVLFAGATHPAAVDLAERLLATMPWHDGRVFYSDNGSISVEVALKMAY